jgi:Dihydrouridine synthase (Dus)
MSMNQVAQILHSTLQNQPDLLEFCTQTKILDRINNWLLEGTEQSKQQARELIQNTSFPEQLANQTIEDLYPKTLIIGNGDVMNYDEGLTKAVESGVDGIMIGRGIFKDPWAFLPRETVKTLDTKKARLELLLEHLLGWEMIWQGQKNFAAMKKFVKMYINGFDGAAELRGQFMDLTTSSEMIILCQKELGKIA